MHTHRPQRRPAARRIQGRPSEQARSLARARARARAGARPTGRRSTGRKAGAAVLAALFLAVFSGPLFSGLKWVAGMGGKPARAAEGPLLVYLSADAGAEPLVCTGTYAVPFVNEGFRYWEGYVCRAEDCPGRKGNAPALFPAVPAKRGGAPVAVCPWCAKAGRGEGKPDRECVAEAQKSRRPATR